MNDLISPKSRDVSSSMRTRRILRWLVGTGRGFETRDRIIVRLTFVFVLVYIVLNISGIVVDQYVRNWIGWGNSVDKQLHEYTSLSKEDYDGLSQRWKQVLAEALVGDSDHLPSAVDLLSWIEVRDLNAIGKIAPLVLNNRAVYAEDLAEISALSGVDIQDLWRLEKIGFVDETPGGFLAAWNGESPVILGGDNVFLFGEVGNRRFGLRRMTLTPSGAYIIRLLEPDTDLEYLQRVAEEIEKKGVEVEMVYGDIEFSDGEILIYGKSSCLGNSSSVWPATNLIKTHTRRLLKDREIEPR